MRDALFGVLGALGLLVLVLVLAGVLPLKPRDAAARERARERRAKRTHGGGLNRLEPLHVVQIAAGVLGMVGGWLATDLLGIALLVGGMGVLLPPFMAAPQRRRRQSKEALAWQMWTRQLAELARAGLGLTDLLRGSVAHAPSEISRTVERVAATAELDGVEAACDELAASGKVWEPEVAAGLRLAATAGGAIAHPLLDLGARIGDVVDLHRTKNESVVQLWTQTIALLCLAGGVVLVMYRNNPAYFEPFQGGGQLVLVAIALLLLLCTAFLVRHSVVREPNSILVPPRRQSRAKDPL